MNNIKNHVISRFHVKLMRELLMRGVRMSSTFKFPDRTIGRTNEEYENERKIKVPEPEIGKRLEVSIIGSPNAGKSTLINSLLGWRVCSVSNKVHTTQRNTKAVLIENETQIVFTDTPGLISLTDRKKHHLTLDMLYDPAISLNSAQLIIVLVDVSNRFTRHKLDLKLIELLEKNVGIPSVLVLNKIDCLKSKLLLLELTRLLTEGIVGGKLIHLNNNKKKLNEVLSIEEIIAKNEKIKVKEIKEEKEKEIKEKNGWPHFHTVFMLSALDGDGVPDLKKYLLSCASVGNWIVRGNVVTDQKPEEIITLAVREKLLDKLPKQIPYQLKLTIELLSVEDNVLKICMNIGCLETSWMKLVIGAGGKGVCWIADAARQELMNTFRCEVSLKLIVTYIGNKKPKNQSIN
ncbi:hypothetical protein CHUAL_006013 [Chamberlinius hualienensis]